MAVQIDNDYKRAVKQLRQIEDALMGGSITGAQLRQPLQAIIERRFEPVDVGEALRHGRFASPEQQVANLRAWNNWLGYFREDQIEAVHAAIPEGFNWTQPLVALTLCWTMNTLEQSVATKIEVMRRVYGKDKVIVSDRMKRLDEERLYLPDGAPAFLPNELWWEVIDLGASRDKAPDQVDLSVSAGTQVYDVACQHPVYVGQHNGRDVPYLDVPGLRVKVPGESKPCAPYIDGLSDGGVGVGAYWAGLAYSDYAEPVLVRES